jgi:hypothetical protein
VVISGTVFFDATLNGAMDPDEKGLDGVKVQLYQNNIVVSTATTSNGGAYLFSVVPGTYTIDVVEPTGLTPTSTSPRDLSKVTSSLNNVNFGLFLNLSVIRGLKASGYTIGYWKNNIEKAIAGKTGGTQVGPALIKKYTDDIAVLYTTAGLPTADPFYGMTRESAVALMGSTSSLKTDLLAKQLLASEYNYASGGYIGGANGKILTYTFIAWGEYVLKNYRTNDAYLIFAQQWFDAYNNSHGGLVLGPLP